MNRPFLLADNDHWFESHGTIGRLEFDGALPEQGVLWYHDGWKYVSPADVVPFPMHRTLIVVRGLPGAGKSHLATRLVYDIMVNNRFMTCNYEEADKYMVDEHGGYRFDVAKLPYAHARCQDAIKTMMINNANVAIVSNTFTQNWEMEPYLSLACAYGYVVHVIDLFDAGLSDEALADRNQHHVPVEVIRRMRERWELLRDTRVR